MKPLFKINNHDYTKYLADEGLKPERNDLDADGSGRNILNGLMYRKRIATKLKYTVSFLRLDEDTLARLEEDMSGEYVQITTLDAKTKSHVTRTYYCSTINEGVQRHIGGHTFYDGVTFNIIER